MGHDGQPCLQGLVDSSVPNIFPKTDPYCQTFIADYHQPALCTLDDQPFANDLHDAARSTSRGDTLSRAFWNSTALPPAYKKVAPQTPGQRAVMGFTDAATAARYSLPVAKLLNSSGAFVAPTSDAVLAGLKAMTPGAVSGVLSANPSSADPAAYPLTTLTYAVTAPGALSTADRADYADLLHYAATSGQVPGLDTGELPLGDVPLPSDMVQQTLTVATSLRNYVAPAPTSSTTAQAPSGKGPTTAPTTSSAGTATKSPTPTKSRGRPSKSPSPSTTTSPTPAPTTSSGFAVRVVPPPPIVDRTPPPATAGVASPTSPQATPPPDTPNAGAVASTSRRRRAPRRRPPPHQTTTREIAAITAECPWARDAYAVIVVFAIGGSRRPERTDPAPTRRQAADVMFVARFPEFPFRSKMFPCCTTGQHSDSHPDHALDSRLHAATSRGLRCHHRGTPSATTFHRKEQL